MEQFKYTNMRVSTIDRLGSQQCWLSIAGAKTTFSGQMIAAVQDEY